MNDVKASLRLQKYKGILFDLDGTLSQSELGITKSIQFALQAFNIDEPLSELSCFIGPPLDETFINRYGFSENEAKKAIERYREYFSEYGMYQNQPYEGVREMLDKLYRTGAALFVATSKPTYFAEKILKKDGLDIYFKRIVGSELDGRRSKKSEVIRYILEEEGISPEALLMVGDREHDLIGARNNDMDCVGVLYGYGSRNELEFYKPIAIVGTIDELSDYLHSVIAL